MIKTDPASSITGSPFDDVLNELHAHAFSGVPGESRAFTLPLLEREYIAYTLACYYQCQHCVQYHGTQITRALHQGKPNGAAAAPGPASGRPWDENLENAVLYLRIEKAKVSDDEWSRWENNWRKYAGMVRGKHGFCLSVIAYAVGIARDDEHLMEFIFPHLSQRYPDNNTLDGVVGDIVRVVVFMKAATTKNRVSNRIKRQLKSRGIE